MKYRSKTEISSNILEISIGGVSKTKMMYRSFVSHSQLKQYVTALLENGLLEFDAVDGVYRTTEKGLRFLAISNEVDRMIRPKNNIITEPEIAQNNQHYSS